MTSCHTYKTVIFCLYEGDDFCKDTAVGVEQQTQHVSNTDVDCVTRVVYFSGWQSKWNWISNTTKPNSNEEKRISYLWTSCTML